LHDLLQTSLFLDLKEGLLAIVNRIKEAKIIQIVSPADMEGVLALSQLEAALLDVSIPYRRRLQPPRRHVPRDEVPPLPEGDGLTIHIDPFEEAQNSMLMEDGVIHIHPIQVEVEFESSSRSHHGALDCVAICGTIAAIIAPDGARVRKQRAMVLAGTWLSNRMESNYDPVMSLLRDHLDSEGSIDVRPLPEVSSPAPDMIPGLSAGMLKRLCRSWAGMDFEERSGAISELVLPCLKEEGLSTMRIEELIWHRAIVPGHDVDIASQLHLALEGWPEESDASRVHASGIADNLIKQGHL